MTNNYKPFPKKKTKDSKLVETDTKLDLRAFVKVTRTNETGMFSLFQSKADTKVDALVSASFGFVLRSPNGSETKPAGDPHPFNLKQQI